MNKHKNLIGLKLSISMMMLAFGNVAYASSCSSGTNTELPGDNVACGDNNLAGGVPGGGSTQSINNTALGISNVAQSGHSTAVGDTNYATAPNSTSVGTSNYTYNSAGTALGATNFVGSTALHDGVQSTAIGSNNLVRTNGEFGGGTALGKQNTVYGQQSTAIGDFNNIGYQQGSTLYYSEKATALGYNNGVNGNGSSAIGNYAQVGLLGQADNALAIGAHVKADGNNSLVMGTYSKAQAEGSIAMGSGAFTGTNAYAAGSPVYASTNAIAIGTGAMVYGTSTTTGASSVAIGNNALSTGNNSVALGSNSSDSGQSNVVAVGAVGSERRIVNLAAGTAATDAVNVSQLNSLGTSTVAALGTGNYVASSNSITGVNYMVGGSTFTSVAGAVGALQSYNPGGYFAATGVGVASAAAPDATAMGANSLAQGNFSVAAGNGAFATGDRSTALGSGTSATGAMSTAVGYNATASNQNATAIGYNATSTGTNSVALGSNSNDGGRSNVVSVGSSSAQRQITNVAAGTQGTDAVNLNQLNAAVSGTNSAINGLQNQMNSAKAGIAGVTAATNLPGLNNGQKYNFGIGWGNYMAYNGMAVGGHARVTENVTLKVSGSATSGVYSGGAGMAIGF